MSQNQENQSDRPSADERIQLLLQRAEQGDRDVLPALREFLDAHPEVWQQAGNLALQAERSLISVAAGPDLLLEQSIRRQLDAMRSELLGPSPSPLHKLMVEQVVQSWLQKYHADVLCAQRAELSGPQRAYLQRRQDQAQKGYLAALKALATMQKLLPTGMSERNDGPESSDGAHCVDARGGDCPRDNHGSDGSREPLLPDFFAERMGGLVGNKN